VPAATSDANTVTEMIAMRFNIGRPLAVKPLCDICLAAHPVSSCAQITHGVR
jgi:hypothetical protein